ncbi:MAG: ABC transporter permease [Myxococcaceae bacterium]|nr:ABC transporter permease [Myxococcaceae bacterium]
MRRYVLAVFLKEAKDHLRDQRALTSALFFPLFGPVLLTIVMQVMAGWAAGGQSVKVAVVGAERAPNLILFLRQYGAAVRDAPLDYERRIQEGDIDAALVISEDYAENWARGRPATVQLVSDESRRASAARVQRLEQLLASYSGMIAAQRLMVRGVSPDLARVVQVDRIDLATPEKLAALLLNMIPILLVIAAFVGGMNVAIDAMAGERERGSLEPLLTNPVPRGAVIAGKWLITVGMACVSVVITLVGFAIAVGQVPLEELGVKASLGAPELLGILAAILPLTLFASAVQMLVATYARSFKEAQTWLSLLLLVPTIPGMILAFAPFEPTFGMNAVPVLGQHLLVDRILAGEGLNGGRWLLSLAAIVPLSALCLWVCTRLLHQERIIFGR